MVLATICVLAFKVLYKKMVDHPHDDYGIAVFLSGILALGLWLGVIISFCNCGSLTLAGFFNPDYWALHQILHP